MDVYEWIVRHGYEFDQQSGYEYALAVEVTEEVHEADEGYFRDHDDGPCEQQLQEHKVLIQGKQL